MNVLKEMAQELYELPRDAAVDFWSLPASHKFTILLVSVLFAGALWFGGDVNLAQPAIDSQDTVAGWVELK